MRKYLTLLALLLVALGAGNAGVGRLNASRFLSPPRAGAQTPPSQNIAPGNLCNLPSGSYGCMGIAAYGGNLYLGADKQGVLRSTDQGVTWQRIDITSGCDDLATGRLWSMAADQHNGTLWTANGYGCGQGIWRSVDGGIHWQQMMSPTLGQATTGDILGIQTDPYLANHVLVTSHSGWNFGANAGVLETLDNGVSWVVHPALSWSYGQEINFLNNSATWLLSTPFAGQWKTTDSGANWHQVSTNNMMHGGGDHQLYHASSGWYLATDRAILRSTDNGETWVVVLPSTVPDGYMAIIGDGTNLYTRTGNTGHATTGPLPMLTSAEADGLTWVAGTQPFDNGPGELIRDASYVYSTNWNAGVWRLPIGGVPSTPVVPTATATITPTVSVPTATPTPTAATSTSTPAATSTPTSTPTPTASCEIVVRVNGQIQYVTQSAGFCAGAHP